MTNEGAGTPHRPKHGDVLIDMPDLEALDWSGGFS